MIEDLCLFTALLFVIFLISVCIYVLKEDKREREEFLFFLENTRETVNKNYEASKIALESIQKYLESLKDFNNSDK